MRKTTHKDGSITVTTELLNAIVTIEAGESLAVTLNDKEGNEVPSIPAEAIDEGLARGYKGFYGILGDLREAIKALEHLLTLPESALPLIRHSLIANAIVTYGRCFTSAEGRGASLQASPPWINSSIDEFRWHELLMRLRNQFFAHAGESPFRSVLALIVVDSKDKPKNVHGIYSGTFELGSFSNEDADNCIKYLKSLIERVAKKTDQLAAKLQSEANLTFK